MLKNVILKAFKLFTVNFKQISSPVLRYNTYWVEWFNSWKTHIVDNKGICFWKKVSPLTFWWYLEKARFIRPINL